jgi:tRNA-guanine transglycosylases, various specificities
MTGTTASYTPIGGVVPLLEQYNYSTLVDIILTSKLNSDFSKPIHLFGGGHPMFMAMAVLMGVDMFDSASYVKYARDGRLLYSDGTRYLDDVTELPFWSPLRDKYSINELKKVDEGDKHALLAEHNLFAIYQELSEIRERIRENTLWQYVEGKSRNHPALFAAFRKLLTYSGSLEPYQELYRKSPIFHFGSETNMGPYGERLKKISGERGIMERAPQGTWKPARMNRKFIENIYEKTDKAFSIDWYGIDVPIEMEESYPVEQVVAGSYEEIKGIAPEKESPSEGRIRSFNL